jgi:hypothetical protein
MSEWLSGLASWAGIAAIALGLWGLLGLFVSVGFGHLVASDDGRAAVRDVDPQEFARGEPRLSGLSGQVVRAEATPGPFPVAAHTPSPVRAQGGEFRDRGRTARQPEAAHPVRPHHQTEGGHGAC